MSEAALFFYGGIPVLILTMFGKGYSMTRDTLDPVTGKSVPASTASVAAGYFLILLALVFCVLGIYSMVHKK